jgi:hypothetical protein
MRASEAERETAVRDLRGHAAVGRLEMDELEERVGAAFAARTREELAALSGDLPSLPQSGFGGHMRAFFAVQLLLVAIWALSGMGYFWPIWPFMGWGIGLVLHGVCDEVGRQSVWASGSRRTHRRRAIGS